jgi:toxin ParE1/3/4
MILRYSTPALADLDAIAEKIQVNSSRAAMRFLEATEGTAERLITFPDFGAVYETDEPELQDLRVCLVEGFEKHLLFYRIIGDDVIVTRILHGHRDLTKALKESP